jgi:hypothetical protein
MEKPDESFGLEELSERVDELLRIYSNLPLQPAAIVNWFVYSGVWNSGEHAST